MGYVRRVVLHFVIVDAVDAEEDSGSGFSFYCMICDSDRPFVTQFFVNAEHAGFF